MIPLKRPGRLPKYDFKSMTLEQEIDAGKFSRDLMLKIGGMLYYFNKQLKPMKFVQRKKDGKVIIYREQ